MNNVERRVLFFNRNATVRTLFDNPRHLVHASGLRLQTRGQLSDYVVTCKSFDQSLEISRFDDEATRSTVWHSVPHTELFTITGI